MVWNASFHSYGNTAQFPSRKIQTGKSGKSRIYRINPPENLSSLRNTIIITIIAKKSKYFLKECRGPRLPPKANGVNPGDKPSGASLASTNLSTWVSIWAAMNWDCRPAICLAKANP